uniref:Thyroxine-binding globulin n=1 Tax=Mola mola TaxID=94237 RepID=A0A3Q3WR67_MOLML
MLYDTNCSATVVRLAQSQRLATLLLLPKAELQPLEQCLSDSRMSFWLIGCHPGSNIDSLKMGITDTFSDHTDFFGISDETMLKVSKVSHRAVLNVDEKGTTAAAGTILEVMPMIMPQTMKIDRPFLVFILEYSTRNILFMGKITNPTSM